MKLLRPALITDSVLTDSNLTLETQWNSMSTYAAGNVRRGTGDLAHELYESLQNSNTNHAVTDGAWWLPIGSCNRWAKYDGSPQSQSTNPDEIADTLEPVVMVDSFAAQNISAAQLTLQATHPTDGLVWDETINLTDTSAIVDAWTYCFEPIVRKTYVTLTDLPPYANLEIDWSLTAPGETVGVGLVIVGLSRDLGGTIWGFNVGIQDYSRKEADDFGNYDVVERAFAKRANFPVIVEGSATDFIYDLLAGYRATPVLWIGDERYGSSAVYGFFKDLDLEVTWETISHMTLEIEGIA